MPPALSPGPEPTPEQAERAVLNYLAGTLKDPGSLQQFRMRRVAEKRWQDTRWSPWKAGWIACFEYNAKNSYGGYVGLKLGGLILHTYGTEPVIQEVVPDILLPSWC